jgi:rare lipoprotein A
MLIAALSLAAAVPQTGSPAYRGPAIASFGDRVAHALQRDVERAAVRYYGRGKVTYYGSEFAGRRTASGERFDPRALTMAHRLLPLGTIVDVTNNANGRRVRLRVNDRGPVRTDRIGDVSLAAAKRLGFVDAGIADATIDVVSAGTGTNSG